MDRLLGEHGILRDRPAGRQEFERRMERRRLEESDPESLKALRRCWYLGSGPLRQQMLENLEGKLGEQHSGELRRATAEAKAERLIGEELQRLGWTEGELAARRKSDLLKLAFAARLRREPTLSLKAIAGRVPLGASKGANTNLHQWISGTLAVARSLHAGPWRATLASERRRTLGKQLAPVFPSA